MSTLRLSEVEEAPEPVTADLFRSVFRDHAARVVVVTAAGRPAPVGFTATSLASVSLDPPMVSLAVARSASEPRALMVAIRCRSGETMPFLPSRSLLVSSDRSSSAATSEARSWACLATSHALPHCT